MPSDKSKSKSKKGNEGSVGFMYGDVMKGSHLYFFWSEEPKPETKHEEMRNYYGRHVTCKFVKTENPEKVFTKLKQAFTDSHRFGDLYSASVSSVFDKLRELAGVKKGGVLKERPEDNSGSGDEKTKKSKSKPKKDAKADSDESGEDNDANSDNDDKDDKDDESGSDSEKEETPPKKVGKSKKNKKADSDESGEDEDEKSDDEKPKKSKSTKGKGKGSESGKQKKK